MNTQCNLSQFVLDENQDHDLEDYACNVTTVLLTYWFIFSTSSFIALVLVLWILKETMTKTLNFFSQKFLQKSFNTSNSSWQNLHFFFISLQFDLVWIKMHGKQNKFHLKSSWSPKVLQNLLIHSKVWKTILLLCLMF